MYSIHVNGIPILVSCWFMYYFFVNYYQYSSLLSLCPWSDVSNCGTTFLDGLNKFLRILIFKDDCCSFTSGTIWLRCHWYYLFWTPDETTSWFWSQYILVLLLVLHQLRHVRFNAWSRVIRCMNIQSFVQSQVMPPFSGNMGKEKYRPLKTFYRITMPKFLKTGQ